MAAIPSANMVAQTPMATARCRGSVNILLSNARVEGIKVAPAMPSAARAAISNAALEA